MHRIQISRESWGVAWDGRHLLVSQASKILKLDPHKNYQVVGTVSTAINGNISCLKWDGSYVWCGVNRDNKISRVDLENGVIISSFSFTMPSGVAYIRTESGTHLWCTSSHPKNRNSVYELKMTGAVVKKHELPGAVGVSSHGMNSGGGLEHIEGNFFWNSSMRIVRKVSMSDLSIQDVYDVPTGAYIYDIAWDGDLMWVISSEGLGGVGSPRRYLSSFKISV